MAMRIGGAGYAIGAGGAILLLVGLSLARSSGGAPAPAPPPHPAAETASGRPSPRAATSPAAPVARPAPAPPAPDAPLVVRRVLSIDGPFRHGDYKWDDAGVPPGPIVVTVDLAAETLSVFRGGYEIGAAVILYGADDKPTPLGIFPITQKDARHVSSLYGAPMPYMLRLTGDGVSIHGSPVETEMGTHGCIGVPKPFARKLFAAARVGDRVIITRGRILRMGQAIEGEGEGEGD